ncbi:MAG: hypothetical protein IT370_10655 [Deltaproteobacteria bacterium]|nr:hypothetical protein [Deltaproteobacteria bacterium]
MQRRSSAARATLRVPGPPDAAVVVDGTFAGLAPLELAVAEGAHAVAIWPDGSPPWMGVASVPKAGLGLTPPGAPLDPAEAPGALRLRLEAGLPLAEREAAAAAQALGVEALVVLEQRPSGLEIALLGPSVAAFRQQATGNRLEAVRELARAAAAHLSTACALRHAPPDKLRAGQPAALSAQVGPCVAKVRAAYRRAGSAPWEGAEREPQGPTVELSLPHLPSSDRPYLLEYHLWAESRTGRSTGAFGSPQAPLRLQVEPDRTPLLRNPWLWTAVGAVVVGGGAAVLLTLPPKTSLRL